MISLRQRSKADLEEKSTFLRLTFPLAIKMKAALVRDSYHRNRIRHKDGMVTIHELSLSPSVFRHTCTA
jgi:hypothetical protein